MALRMPVPRPLRRRAHIIHLALWAEAWNTAPMTAQKAPRAMLFMRPWVSPMEPPMRQPMRVPR